MAPGWRNYLDSNMPFYLDLLQQMVGINSFTANPAGVNKLGRLTAEIFAPLGFTAEFVPPETAEFGEHLVLTTASQWPEAPTITLVSHLDTVYSEAEEAAHEFHWRPEGKIIYGPGTVDIKGGTVLIYMLLDGLRQQAPEVFNSVNWQILLDSQEETGGLTFGPLCEARLAGNAAALVFEGGSLQDRRFKLVVARKGMVNYEIRTIGRSAHAGNGHANGANAIVQLADVVRKVAALTNYENELTYNVGTIYGGTVTNRVPHYAEARVEMRTFDQGVYEQGIVQMLALQEAVSVSDRQGEFACAIEIEVVRKTMPWPRNEGTDMLYDLWSDAAGGLGMDTIQEERGGLSDGNHFWQLVPTLDGLGPAGGNAHCSERTADGSKDQEYVVPASFVPKTMINTMGVLALLERLRG